MDNILRDKQRNAAPSLHIVWQIRSYKMKCASADWFNTRGTCSEGQTRSKKINKSETCRRD